MSFVIPIKRFATFNRSLAPNPDRCFYILRASFKIHQILYRNMGGYIEDAQIAQLGLEFYQDIYGEGTLPPMNFIIPRGDERWPVHLWGYQLGVGYEKHIAKHVKHKKLGK